MKLIAIGSSLVVRDIEFRMFFVIGRFDLNLEDEQRHYSYSAGYQYIKIDGAQLQLRQAIRIASVYLSCGSYRIYPQTKPCVGVSANE